MLGASSPREQASVPADLFPWRGPADVDNCGRKMTRGEWDAENRAKDAAKHARRNTRRAMLEAADKRRADRQQAAAPKPSTSARPRGAGRPRAKAASRSAASSTSSSSDDGPPGSSEPPPGRLTTRVVGAPSAASDTAVARFLERWLERTHPGTTWTAERPVDPSHRARDRKAAA